MFGIHLDNQSGIFSTFSGSMLKIIFGLCNLNNENTYKFKNRYFTKKFSKFLIGSFTFLLFSSLYQSKKINEKKVKLNDHVWLLNEDD